MEGSPRSALKGSRDDSRSALEGSCDEGSPVGALRVSWDEHHLTFLEKERQESRKQYRRRLFSRIIIVAGALVALAGWFLWRSSM